MTEEPPSPLLIDSARLAEMLGPARGRFNVDVLPECASTNSVLLDRASGGAPSGSVLVADRQTAGRGSRGRSWLAAPEASLTFSVLWRFPGGIERLSGLSLAVGVAVVEALAQCGVPDAQLKWPNDILYAEGKLGGILVEVQCDDEAAQVVIGIGLNLRRPPEFGLADGFALAPVALEEVITPLPDRHVLFAQLLIALASVLDRFELGGFAVLRPTWQAHHAWQDRPVRMLRDGCVEHEGVCLGADEDGALLVRTSTGLERCLSGDLSLRPSPC